MLFLLALLPASAATLDVLGPCGGPVTITLTGLPPLGPYVIFSADGTGSSTVSGGSCTDIQLGLDSTRTFRKKGLAGPDGRVTLTLDVPPQLCGTWLQAVDGGTCTATNVDRFNFPLDADGDRVDAEFDCDDSDATVYPGAPELCDDQPNDCDQPGRSEDGVVTWVDRGGARIEDLTADFAAGTETSPALIDIGGTHGADQGTLSMCAGTYYASVAVTGSNVVLEGRPGTHIHSGSEIYAVQATGGRITMRDFDVDHGRLLGSTLSNTYDVTVENVNHNDNDCPLGPCVVFANFFAYPASLSVTDMFANDWVSIDADQGMDITITGLSIDSGDLTIEEADTPVNPTTFAIDDLYINQGFVRVSGPSGSLSNLTLYDADDYGVLVAGGTVSLTSALIDGAGGNGLWSLSGDVTVDDLVVRRAGFGIAATNSADVTVTASDVRENTTGLSVATGSNMHLIDTLVRDNTSTIPGQPGGALVDQEYSVLRCTKTGAAVSGFVRNAGPTGGAVQFANTATNLGQLFSEGCDWGFGGDDNTPVDIRLADGSSYNYTSNATFSCTDAVESICF